jgi:toxin ParE1/3/4
MDEHYPVYWSKAAESDLLAIIRYIRDNSPQAAVKAFAGIKDKTSDLVMFPARGRIVPELLAQGVGHYRELIIPPWRVIYRFSGDAVYILSVIDSRRNVEDILLDRLIRPQHEAFLP